jgi:VanZ family protein
MLWTVFITVLSLISLGSIEQTLNTIHISNKDKIVHFTFYFVFVVLWYLQIINKIKRNPKIVVLVIAIAYGIAMEICQGFTDTRVPDLMDVVANSLGAIFGLLFITTYFKLRKSRN